ncbi:MAG: cohesin domain-containing protein [Bacteroidota bacterium]
MNFTHRPFLLLLIFVGITINTIAQQKSLFLDSVPYSCASSFNVSLRTKNISKTVGLQGTIRWDTAIVKYNGISYGNSAILFSGSNMNLTQTNNGFLNYIWFDDNLVGKSTTDSTVLFTIAFTRNGIGKGKATVSFSSSPTSLEIDTLKIDGTPIKDQNALFKNGVIVTPYIYTFNGSGNWNNPANWSNGMIPPLTLPICSEINIDPITNSECILNVTQNIAAGAKLTVKSNKKFKIPGVLTIH